MSRRIVSTLPTSLAGTRLGFVLALAIWAFSVSVAPAGNDSTAGIIPAPAECERLAGVFTIESGASIQCGNAEEIEAARFLRDGLKARAGLDLPLAGSGTNGESGIRLELVPGGNGTGEGYQLEIASNNVTVRAASGAGFFYGVQSLLQIADAAAAAGHPRSWPALWVADEPRFAWRGLMLDESRAFFGKQTVKELLDSMASLKLNRFHWHLTDEPGWRVEVKRYPNLTTIGARGNWSDPAAPLAYYTQADIREIVAYASERHIEIIPEIDLPGHATAATRAYPGISGGGEGQWNGFTFNPAKEETYVFLENVFAEMAALFPGLYLHLGGDEVHYGNQSWSADPEILKFTRDHGQTNAAELEQYFVRRISGVIQRLGKTTAGWDEVADAGLDPSRTVVMWWHHEKPERLTRVLAEGFPVVLCPRLPCYFDFVQDETHQVGRRWKGSFNPLTDVYNFPDPAINSLLPSGRETNVLGIEACLWTERIQNRERLAFMTYPRLAALAEAAWTPAPIKDADGFRERLHLFYRELDRRHIPYFNLFDTARTPEPPGPEKKTGSTANG